jgi:6-pyruvoyltetrahydropterin/6-carboxytetrahydropterin synthase
MESTFLDNAGMVYDFGLMKNSVKSFIDSMDHCYILCDKDAPEFRDFIKKNCDRWIELPFNPSAECLSMYLLKGIKYIMDRTVTQNGESKINVTGVRYHETVTGWAEASTTDLDVLWQDEWWDQIKYSEGVTNDWAEDLLTIIIDGEKAYNPTVQQQINLK